MFGDPGSDRTIRRKGRRATETREDFEVSEAPSSAEGDIVDPDEAWADENEPGPQPAADYAPRADTDDAPAS